MRVGSLFAGIGGFDLAAEQAGMEVLWQSEIDSHASRVLAHHWPHVKNLGDVHGIGCACHLQERVRREDLHQDSAVVNDGRRIGREKSNAVAVLDEGERCGGCGRARPSAVDVLTGGFPCQDYSVAGARGGLAGDRGALWWEYHRLITSLRPTWIVGENVPGLLSSRGGADFETIIGSLTECGYGVAWAVLDAQYFGVAQRRRRVFIVGHSGGEPRPEVLALSEGLFGHPPPGREKGEGIAGTLESRPSDGRGRAEEGHLISFDWQAGAGSERTWVADAPGRTRSLTANRSLAVAFAQNQRDELRDLDDLAGALAAESGMKQRTYVAQIQTRLRGGTVHDEVDESDLAQSLLGADGGSSRQRKLVIGTSVRRLTPLECERLQGFPDDWTATPGNSDSQRYRQLGNAVAVPVVAWIMGRLVGAGKLNPG